LVAISVMFDGAVKSGAASMTVTANEPETASLPESVTVQFTVVLPNGSSDPDAGAHTAGMTPSSASCPAAVNSTIAPAALVAVVVMSAGGVNVGAVLAGGGVGVAGEKASAPPGPHARATRQPSA